MSSGDFDVRVLDDLVRIVVRAFYQDEHVVVMDAIVREHRA